MRFQTNLSQRPFHNRKLFWFGFLVVMTLTVMLGRWTIGKIAETDTLAVRLKRDIDTDRQKLKVLQQQQPTQSGALLSDGEIKQIQGAALLIEQRKFSWTAMLREFERQLPPSVRILTISMRGDKDEDLNSGLTLNVKLFAKSVEDVTKMISAADKRGIFRIQPRSQQSVQGSEDVGFDLEVTYLPSQGVKPAATKKNGNENEQFAKEGRN